MRALWYQIYHIDGEENRLPDLGTRWGNRFLSRAAFKRGLRMGPSDLFKSWARGQKHGLVRRKCALRLPQAKVHEHVVPPDGDAESGFVLPRPTDMVHVKYLKQVQKQHASERPKQYNLEDGLWKNAKGEVWVPDNARQLQHIHVIRCGASRPQRAPWPRDDHATPTWTFPLEKHGKRHPHLARRLLAVH